VILAAFFSHEAAAEVDRVRHQIRSAKPGDVIELPSGTYKDVEIVLDVSGTESKPITLRAAQPGKSVFTGTSSIRINGKHLVVDGVHFTGDTTTKAPPIGFGETSEHCRLTNSAVIDFNAPFDVRFHYVRVGGKNHRIDHNLFTGKTNMGPMLAADGGTQVRVDHNHFRDFPHNPKNGREVIQIIGVGSNDEPLAAGGAHWVVEQNLFERAHGEGAEIISVKSNHNVVRHNTVRATKGALTMRSGGGNTFDGNFIFGDGMEDASGLRVSGTNGKAVNNYVSGVSGTAIRLHAGEYIEKDISGGYERLVRQGAPLGHVAHYLQLKDGVVSNNIVVGTTGIDLEYGAGYCNGWPKQQMVLLPDNLVLQHNLFVAQGGDGNRPVFKLNPGDDKIEKLPPDARPRPAKGKNNYAFGGATNVNELPAEWGFRAADPKLIADAKDALYRPAPDSPAVAGGFDVTPFVKNRPVTAAEVGPEWARVVGP
jgi:poly(beta-D-mannuronate) lyase